LAAPLLRRNVLKLKNFWLRARPPARPNLNADDLLWKNFLYMRGINLLYGRKFFS
jgi:hypothetical protein